MECGNFQQIIREMKKLDKNSSTHDIEASDVGMNSPDEVAYLGSKISLISKSEIRYEGILYTFDTKDSTIALSNVRSFGTEDRRTDHPVTPQDEIYEYIIFKVSDIKDIRICLPPKPQPTREGGLPNDPAIIQQVLGSTSGSNGPIGSTSFSNSMPESPSQPQNTSPVMDMLNHLSDRSSPTQVNSDSKSPKNKANKEFKEVIEKLLKSSLEMEAANGETDVENNEVEEVEIETETDRKSGKSVKKAFLKVLNSVRKSSKKSEVKKVAEIPLKLLPGQKIF